ncbi:MAG TPA: ATPase [Dehalococcoidia bacterium]|nr:ATPase [Dehalococcoidia bacterium]
MDILHHIDRLEELVGEARKLPVGGGLVLSRQRLLDLIDRMRVAVPKEVYDAREVIDKRDEVLADATAEASRIIARAKEEVEERLKETEVVKAAEERSRQILAGAQERLLELSREAEAQAAARLDDAQEAAREQMREADVYALQTLRKLETELNEFTATVRRGIDTLEKRAAERPG